jgi:hypothetical protein
VGHKDPKAQLRLVRPKLLEPPYGFFTYDNKIKITFNFIILNRVYTYLNNFRFLDMSYFSENIGFVENITIFSVIIF